MKCKALTLRAPWAQLVAQGIKTLEIRSKRTKYRGPLVICAGLKMGDGCGDAVMSGLLTESELAEALEAPRGVALCVVDVVDCRQVSDLTSAERRKACCSVAPHEWAWVLENPRLVPGTPAVRGQQGFFSVDLELDAA